MMNLFSPRCTFMVALAAAAACLPAAGRAQQAQLVLASSSATPPPGRTNSADRAGVRAFLPARLITAQVRDGILTIDGMVAKVQLNYEIQRDGYLYFFVPGEGTAVVSLAPMPGAERVSHAFDGDRLAFAAGGHSFELSGEGNLLGRNRAKTDAYVRFDASATAGGRYPRMGFGNTLEAPYAWPLSAPAARDRSAQDVTPPPIPRNLLPETAATEVSTVSAARVPRAARP